MDHFTTGRAKADVLIAHVALGNHDPIRKLGPDDDVSFGGYAFHYDAEHEVLRLRVLITRLDYGRYGPAMDSGLRESASILGTSPASKMFETDGARNIHDEARNGNYLVKDYPVATTTPAMLEKDTDRIQWLAGKYLMSWTQHILDIYDGKEPPPTHLVTLENDPYPRR